MPPINTKGKNNLTKVFIVSPSSGEKEEIPLCAPFGSKQPRAKKDIKGLHEKQGKTL
jgi:hypothetical protein